MAVQTIDTPDATITIEDRPTGDGKGTAQTVTVVPKAGTPAANLTTLQQRAQAALAANTTYLALASPSVAQNTAQVKTLTKECNALIRLALGLLDDTTGT